MSGPTFREETIRRARNRLAEMRREAAEIVDTLRVLGVDPDTDHEYPLDLVPASEIDVDYDRISAEPEDGRVYPSVESVRDWIVNQGSTFFSIASVGRAFGWETKDFNNRDSRGTKYFAPLLQQLQERDIVHYHRDRAKNHPKWRYNASLPAGPTERPKPESTPRDRSMPVDGVSHRGAVRGHKWLREIRDRCVPGTMMTSRPDGHYEFRLGRKVVRASGTPKNEGDAQKHVLRQLAEKGMLK